MPWLKSSSTPVTKTFVFVVRTSARPLLLCVIIIIWAGTRVELAVWIYLKTNIIIYLSNVDVPRCVCVIFFLSTGRKYYYSYVCVLLLLRNENALVESKRISLSLSLRYNNIYIILRFFECFLMDGIPVFVGAHNGRPPADTPS